MFPEELKFTENHEWVKIEGSVAVVGISEYAQSELGDVVFVELPEPGESIELNESMAVIESVKAVSDVYAPLSGTITEVNSELEDNPELINQSPYNDGFICLIEFDDIDELDSLMDSDSYEEYLEE